jgi:hypothetical protein
MPNESHAQHRPPTDQDPSLARPPTTFGQLYPEHDILAVAPDRTAGERALRALQQAGMPESDMDLLDPDWVLGAGRALKDRRSAGQRLAALLAAEEGSYAKEYEEEARQGHPILVVHAKDRARAEWIAGTLRQHGARRLRYYDRGVILDL